MSTLTIGTNQNTTVEYRVIFWDKKNPGEFETEWYADSFHVAQRVKKLRNSGKVYRVTEHLTV